MRRLPVYTLCALLFCSPASMLAAPPRPGWVKVELARFSAREGPVPAGLLNGFGGEVVGKYGTFVIVSMPDGLVDSLVRRAAQENVQVRRRDDLDQILLPNARVDSRKGIEGAPVGGLHPGYGPQESGLYILQFRGPIQHPWIQSIESIGWKITRYYPNDAYAVLGTPALVERTRNLEYVQFLEIFHPYQKSDILVRDETPRRMIIELPGGVDISGTIAAIKRVSFEEVEVTASDSQALVSASLRDRDAAALLRDPKIVGVWPAPEGKISDEAQAMSLTGNVTIEGQPTNPSTYWSWVLSRCPACATMPASTWIVGVADSGLDNGANTGGHPDLAGRKFFGTRFAADVVSDTTCVNPPFPRGPCTCADDFFCDYWLAHGTFVAGVIAANASAIDHRTGGRDADGDGFLVGMGVAPTAGILATKAVGVSSTGSSTINLGKLFTFTHDAGSRNVAIQNHSFNDYNSDNAGKYTTVSRAYDLAVRDSDDNAANGRTPLFITVSAGNHSGAGTALTSPTRLIAPGGTAKNVLSVGGTEGYRIHDCAGGAFVNLMENTRAGTAMNSQYIKPDVVAPGWSIVSTHTQAHKKQSRDDFLYCDDYYAYPAPETSVEEELQLNYDEYALARGGTSFAAPVGAGAALILKRYLGGSPLDLSPAMTKALLIAGARSIKGGVDKSRPGHPVIGPAPNGKQGFGRLSLDDVLTGATPPAISEDTLWEAWSKGLICRIRDTTKPVTIVLAWSDAPASTSGTLPAIPLVNNLDLKVVRPEPTAIFHVGNRFGDDEESEEVPGYFDRDGVNNVEVVRFRPRPGESWFEAEAQGVNIPVGVTDGYGQDYALVVTNVEIIGVSMGLPSGGTAPSNFVATADGPSVTLSWSAMDGAEGYVVEQKRDSAPWSDAVVVGSGMVTTALHLPNSPEHVVLYRVRAFFGSIRTSPSVPDVAYAASFTDHVLAGPPYPTVKAAQIIELRRAVNAFLAISERDPVYSTADLDPASLVGQPVRSADFTSLLVELNRARTAIGVGLPAIGFRAPAPATGQAISKTHLEDLRAGVQ